MFITNDAFRSPVSALLHDSTESYWLCTELALQQTWFIVTLRQFETTDEDAAEVERTLLLSSLGQVEQVMRQNAGGLLACDSVHVITPRHVNGSEQWRMDLLSAAWVAHEPSAKGQTANIYETAAGEKYAHSHLGTPIHELQLERLLFRLPIKESEFN